MDTKKELISTLREVKVKYKDTIKLIEDGKNPWDVMSETHTYRGLCWAFGQHVYYKYNKSEGQSLRIAFDFIIDEVCEHILNDSYFIEECFFKSPPPEEIKGSVTEVLDSLRDRLLLINLIFEAFDKYPQINKAFNLEQ